MYVRFLPVTMAPWTLEGHTVVACLMIVHRVVSVIKPAARQTHLVSHFGLVTQFLT